MKFTELELIVVGTNLLHMNDVGDNKRTPQSDMNKIFVRIDLCR